METMVSVESIVTEAQNELKSLQPYIITMKSVETNLTTFLLLNVQHEKRSNKQHVAFFSLNITDSENAKT